MKVVVTGAKGTVGQALISQLDPSLYQIIGLDLPEHDASNFDDLVQSSKGSDALIHLAWKDLVRHAHGHTVDPVNNYMTLLAYQMAVHNNLKRVVMASSNHAHAYDIQDKDGRIRPTIRPPVPDSPYGAEKIYMEALGRYFAKYHGLEVICIRIGNINQEDKPRQQTPQRWLSHRDWGRLVDLCLTARSVPDNFQIIYGVSRQPLFDWSNPFGYEPLDSAV